MIRLIILTSLAMIAFAANSVFGRLGLLDGGTDAASYSALRLLSGALMLALLALQQKALHTAVKSHGTWFSATALFVYAATFSYAYRALDAGLGALILFFCVQATMIGWGIRQGHRPVLWEWLGLLVAFIAFIGLVSPGQQAPDAFAASLMALSGMAWGVYSLMGRGTEKPLLATAGNFIRTIPMALGLLAFAEILADGLSLSPFGAIMAVASGAITSALGYALWYECQKSLSPSKAAIIQLSAPAIALLLGVLLLGESLTLQQFLCATAILGGVALAISSKEKA